MLPIYVLVDHMPLRLNLKTLKEAFIFENCMHERAIECFIYLMIIGTQTQIIDMYINIDLN